jgi:hypothetical protein
MASGYVVAGRGDLDALFMARVSAARAGVGYYVASSDIANRYEPIGSGTPIAATKFVASNGSDLASLFRDINQPLLSFPVANGAYTAQGLGIPGVTASYVLDSTALILASDGTEFGLANLGNWISPASGMNLYSAFASTVSGTPINGGAALNTWLNLGTSRQWMLYRGTNGTSTGVMQIQIRRDSDSAIMKTVQITLTVVNT